MSELLNKVVLCKVSISVFNPKRQDTKVTHEVLEERNATSAAGKWVKNLIDPKALDGVVRVSQRARIESYNLSLPWSDEGYRILPITVFMDYQKTMRECRQKFEKEVEDFLSQWDRHVLEAKQSLNGMFNPLDYPTKEQVTEKFAFSVDILPLPTGQDFRVTLPEEEMEKMKADVEMTVKNAEQAAMKDLWRRLSTPIRHMVDRLSQDDSIFRDSLIDNVKDIIRIVPSLNISNDPMLVQLNAECRKLIQHDPETLRLNRDLRRDVASQAREILKKMESYL